MKEHPACVSSYGQLICFDVESHENIIYRLKQTAEYIEKLNSFQSFTSAYDRIRNAMMPHIPNMYSLFNREGLINTLDFDQRQFKCATLGERLVLGLSAIEGDVCQPHAAKAGQRSHS